MSALNTLVLQALSGLVPKFSVSHWDGSYNNHPRSLVVKQATLALSGASLVFDAAFETAAGYFYPPGAHTLHAVVALPHTTTTLSLDGITAPEGRVVILPKQKGLRARVELVAFLATPSDPFAHFRFDGDLHL